MLLIAVLVAFAPFVRFKARQAAGRYGLDLDIQSVRPSLAGATLREVRVSCAAIPALKARFDRVQVSLSGRVEASGGQLELDGPYTALMDQVRAWRSSRASGAGAAEGGSRRVLALRGTSLSWKGFHGEASEVKAEGLTMEDATSGDRFAADSVEARTEALEWKSRDVRVGWVKGSSPAIRSLEASSVAAVVRLPAPAKTDPVEAPDSASKEPPELEEVQDSKKAGTPRPRGAGPATSVSAAAPPAPVAEPAGRPSLRDRLASMALAASTRTTPDAKVDVAAFEVRVERGNDKATLGPGRLAVEWKDCNLVVDLSPGSKGASAGGVTFKATLPAGAGAAHVDVHGGPIQLSALGIREGDLGVRHPERASLRVDLEVELREDGRWVGFDGSVKANDISVYHAKLADSAVEGLAVAARVKGAARLDGRELQLEDSEFDVGALRFMVSGRFERDDRKRYRVDARFGVPLVPCQDAVDSLPATLVPLVHGMRAAGTLSLTGRLRFDPEKPSEYVFEYRGAADCRFTAVPAEVDVARLRGRFKRMAYGPDGKKVELESGPGSAGWVPFGGISQYMEAAVMTTEDGRFRIHHGFDHEAIRNSMKENLLRGAFVRGASTISMQLAKNLYLDRRKTVSRKLQELVLTMYLEQALTKEQILELYLNVVEFGPMVYGIGQASWHYFKCSPTELTPGQAMVLSSMLPNPKISRFGAGGRVHDGWMKYVWKLVQLAGKRGWISEEDVDRAMGEWVVMGGPPVKVEREGVGIEPGGEQGGAN